MSPVTGYSDTRVNTIDSSLGDEFGKWLHSPNYKAIKATANVQNVDNQGRKSFASVLKQAESNNKPSSGIILRPTNRIAIIE